VRISVALPIAPDVNQNSPTVLPLHPHPCFGGRHFRQSGHRHDIARVHHDEARAGAKPRVPQRHSESRGRPRKFGSVENEYCVLAMQIGNSPKPASSNERNFRQCCFGHHVGGAVNLLRISRTLSSNGSLSG